MYRTVVVYGRSDRYQVTTYVDGKTRAALRAVAKADRRTVAEVVRQAIFERLAKEANDGR